MLRSFPHQCALSPKVFVGVLQKQTEQESADKPGIRTEPFTAAMNR